MQENNVTFFHKSEISQRIEELIIELGLKPKAFAIAIGIAPSRLSNILSGRNKPDFDFISAISQKFKNVNIVWLLTGEGYKLIEESRNRDGILYKDISQYKSKRINELSLAEDQLWNRIDEAEIRSIAYEDMIINELGVEKVYEAISNSKIPNTAFEAMMMRKIKEIKDEILEEYRKKIETYEDRLKDKEELVLMLKEKIKILEVKLEHQSKSSQYTKSTAI